ncbi:MAG TPA: NYN domain-containing protein [Candidatus Pacearchaeota archaeon]|nr:NYN domain-containing protein [Candidatus Pacearchaeota archaeon]HOK94371.1 NYN domain-containing protein [Candidatus Pacearchaeota archaeon]HPO75301.1 NYN domain-containing protein [Candidatus Pacearchaeota archaeon]
MAVIKHPEQRVGVFIDVENLYYSAKNLFRARVNFKQILKDTVGERKLIRAIAYVIRTESGEEQIFFEALTHLGIETKIKDLQIYNSFKKADWDVGITVDAIKIAPSLDVILLLSGDGDFIPLVEYLKNHGKQVEIAAFSKSTSSKLKEVADDFFDIGKSKKYLLRKPTTNNQ